MNLSQWDPHIINIFINQIIEEIAQQPAYIIKAFIEGMKRAEQNIYRRNSAYSFHFNLAIFYHSLEDYAQAARLYNLSLQRHSLEATTLYNLALCHIAMQEIEKALELLKQAHEIQPDLENLEQAIENLKAQIKGE